jgi:N-methylhydantoinase B
MTRSALPDIELQIMWNRLIAVVEEQAQTLLRTAFSPIVREAGDLSAGIFDAKGRMLAQAVTGTPGHVNSMAESVKHFIAHFGLDAMKPGDAYITNDPWMGTGHTNDFVITTPCFYKGRLIGLFSCTSHLMDIGGLGFGPDATDVFMEGLYIPFLKILEEGKVNETLMAIIRANTRLPIDTVGDVYSLTACNDAGVRRLIEMMDEFRLESLDILAEHICSRSEAAVRAEIAKLPQGAWSNTMITDGYDAPITLSATTTVSDAGIHVDYTGTSPSVRRGINVPLSYTTAYTVFGLGCVVAARIPNNAGSLAPLTVSAPPGSILNAQKPAAVLIRGRCCQTSCSAACARRSRIACRPKARRASGTSTCAARSKAAAAATTASPWPSPPTAAPARAPRATASPPLPIPRASKARRWRSPSRSHR